MLELRRAWAARPPPALLPQRRALPVAVLLVRVPLPAAQEHVQERDRG